MKDTGLSMAANTSMKAVVWTAYGPPEVLQLCEVPKPAPAAHEVLIRVHAATVIAGDCEMRSLRIPVEFRLPMRLYAGWRRPQRVTILGQEMAGEIEAVGAGVTRFQVGDAIFGTTGMKLGAYAEYVCLPENAVLTRMPANLTFAEAAGVPVGSIEALHFVRQAHIQRDWRVLINGAGGSIGTIAIQLAKNLGAKVTAVDSGEKLAMLRALGADEVIDYTREEFTRRGERYHVILDIVGKSHYDRALDALYDGGSYVNANPSLLQRVRAPFTTRAGSKRVVSGSSRTNAEELGLLEEIRAMIEAGAIKPVVDRSFPLGAAADAHRYVDSGRKQGNVVIVVAGAADASHDQQQSVP